MLPYNHNAFKNQGTSHPVEEMTIFGDPNQLPDKKIMGPSNRGI